MRRRHASLIPSVALLATVSACGGGRSGPVVGVDPLVVAFDVVDPGGPGVRPGDLGDESGEKISVVRDARGVVVADHRIEIPVRGGHGGPYVVTVIRGRLPMGVGIEDGEDPDGGEPRHHFAGIVREEGRFEFRLQVVDGGGAPFHSATKDVVWNVAEGPVAIVDAEPAMIPRGTLDANGDGVVENPLHDALPPVVYSAFSTVHLVVAGGRPPYSCRIVDDPAVPDDGALPLGALIPAASTSIVGAPVEVKPGGVPFVFTVEATDSAGRSARKTLQWQITTPPIVIATPAFGDGRCGTAFTEAIQVVDGIPPFEFELVEEDVRRDGDGEPDVTFRPPDAPIVRPAGALRKIGPADYPAAGDLGPDYSALRVPPEGIFLGDREGDPHAAPGVVTGVPRRRGTFQVVVHVKSALLPNERGQQSWKAYSFSVADSEPPAGARPAFGHDPAYTLEDAFRSSPPFARIPEAEMGSAYNPDAATHAAAGLLLLARGGVPKDGLSDAPHASQVLDVRGLAEGQESPGAYDWTADWNPPDDGDAYATIPPAMEFLGHLGVLRVANPPGTGGLARQGLQGVTFSLTDQQLPIPHAESRTVAFAVGPDRVVITESTSSDTTTTGGQWAMNDHAQRVRICEPRTSLPIIRDLAAADLAATNVVPATTALPATAVAQLLSALNDAGTGVDPDRLMDLLRVVVNPTGWWDDNHGLNASGARPMQHADMNKTYYSYYHNAYGYQDSDGSHGWQPNASAVELPDCTSDAVTHDVASGVYEDGGQLYVFTSADFFGVFVVRRDARVAVPCAFDRSQYAGFGDNWTLGYGAPQSTYRKMPAMTVSPDGRFAAMKLKPTETSQFDTADSTPVVIFALTGERPFDGRSYKVVGSGSSGLHDSGGRYLFAHSMALTNRHLYYVCGNTATGYDSSWHGHYLYRYEIADGSGAVTASASAGALLPSAAGDAQWTLASGVPMQTPFQWFQTFGGSTDVYGNDASNVLESSMARMPFRVSRDGRAIAILAGSDPARASTGNYFSSHVDVYAHHVWVDQEGAGVRRLSSTKRRCPQGAARGYGLTWGPNNHPMWGRYAGPVPGLEISDDASKVAVVVNRTPPTSALSYGDTASWHQNREDVVVFETTDDWVGATEVQVTGDDSGSNRIFGDTALWRFGCLTFTRDDDGLVFWGGCSSWDADSTASYHQDSIKQTGSLYACDLSGATGGTTGVQVHSILPTNDGGNASGIAGPFTTSSRYEPTLANGAFVGTAGVIKPITGFRSPNGDFLYLMNSGALNASEYANYRLVGVNVRSVDTSASINGHQDFRAFAVPDWPAQRGFMPLYGGGYSPYYDFLYRYYLGGPAGAGGGQQVAARSGGTVYFTTAWQHASNQNLATYTYGGPVHRSGGYDYGAYLGQVHCFDADVGGPVQKVSAFSGDTGTMTHRPVQFVFPSPDGTRLAFIRNGYASTLVHREQEILHCVLDAELDASGRLIASPAVLQVEATQGRLCTSIAFDPRGEKLYYAVGTGDENSKRLYEASLVRDSEGDVPAPRVIGSAPMRYEVLHVGR